ncbi:lantibiotic ABC transporter ATP-binding protein [Streptococcus cuniculi]|uniref:Lantibiotic ABC transporter ATP-binding protein n=1 Tax=Streptococcus cuniculi TaxID=1432788 RepID=A0A1Q8E6D6_9STRE|nr:ABC transporter ATP-binding protein [Streptococcus cuniculi]OLF47353.1 lantibiotic ABC transporter ATP-binding protein [Streptococcus cuniculi]
MHLQVEHLQKEFKDKVVLQDLSFEIESGTVCGLLGVNGAGKSTLMKILFGLEKADKGQILMDGRSQNDRDRSRTLGALIESPAIYQNLSAFDNLKTRALLYGISDERIWEVLRLVGLSDTGKKRVKAFSLGMKQRLGIGMAMLTEPRFLILDEPTNGLDPDGIKDLLQLIRSLKEQQMTILVSSHQLHEVSQIADQILILHQGQICYNEQNCHEDDLEQLFFSIVHGGVR